MTDRKPVRTALTWLMKIAFVGLLFYFLTQKGLISLEKTAKAFAEWQLVVPAFLLMLIATLLGILRWHWLLQAQGIDLRFRRTLELAFVGNFFNIALPGAVSGDVVKAFYIGKEVPGVRGRAFGSILFDRLAGLSALLLISAVALVLDLDVLWGSALLEGLKVFLIFAALGVVSGYSFLFFVKESRDPLLLGLQKAESRFPKVGSLTRIYLGIRHYHSHRATVAKTLLISCFTHILVCTACYLFLAALGDGAVERLSVYFVVPLGLLVTAIPILPAGVGTGHAAFGYLFGFIGSQRGADVFSLYAITILTVGAVGGLVYLRFKARNPLPQELS